GCEPPAGSSNTPPKGGRRPRLRCREQPSETQRRESAGQYLGRRSGAAEERGGSQAVCSRSDVVAHVSASRRAGQIRAHRAKPPEPRDMNLDTVCPGGKRGSRRSISAIANGFMPVKKFPARTS